VRREAAAALFVLLGVLGAPARQAAAVCTAAEVMAGCGGACTASCTASACTISRTATVTPPTPGATCTFDFGTRDVTLQSGGFVGGSNTFEIRAHKLTLNTGGRLTAAGGTELAFAVAGIAGLSVSAYVWLRSRAVPLVEEQPA